MVMGGLAEEMLVDFLAGEPHFLDHLYPIWEALPLEARGQVVLASRNKGSGVESVTGYAIRRGYRECLAFRGRDLAYTWLTERSGPLVVASLGDGLLASKTGRPLVFCEHGAGQTYHGGSASYAGSRRREGVALFLCPNEHTAERNRQAHPQVPAIAIGCPKLDAWHRRPPKPRSEPPVLAVSFHWDCRVCAETRWAFPYYRPELARLTQFGRVLGHGHPRAWPRLSKIYPSMGLELVADFEAVMEQADLYICDNSSTLYEFASLDRPVVVLNAPWYRREVEHGLRFWEAADVGVQCDHPGQLEACVKTALADEPPQQAARTAAVKCAYAYTDGRCAERAAGAIMELL